MNPSSHRPATTVLIAIFVLTLGFRLAFVFIPRLADLPPRSYNRVLSVANAARNVLDGRGAVVDREWVARAEKAWTASARRLPPEPSQIPSSDHPDFSPFYDEKGYLALDLAFAWLTGDVHWLPPILLQCLVSAMIAVILCIAVADGFASRWGGILFGVVYAFHPLECALAVGPDLPVWGVYAGALSLSLVVWPRGPHSLRQYCWIFAAGCFLAFCIVQRGPNAAVVGAALAGLTALRGVRAAACALAGCALVLVLFARLPLASPSVGRAAYRHTLLAGLSEFGDIEGLAWDDSGLLSYLQKRHGVDIELLTPEFDAAAKQELAQVLRERPWLPLKVAARRLGEFAVAWRPARSDSYLLAAFTIFKLAVIAGGVWAYRFCRKRGRRAAFAWGLAAAIAPILAHALIVPLLEVYIASTFVLLTPLAIIGGAAVAWPVLRRLRPTPASVGALLLIPAFAAPASISRAATPSVVIDATGKSFRAVQDEFYAAIESIISSSHLTLVDELPFRVKLTGTTTCRFDDATDYGDLRVCLGVFASGKYSKDGRPTPAPKSFNMVPRGGFVIDLDGFDLRFDADAAGIQTKPVIGLMIGSGYFSGYRTDCSKLSLSACDGFQWGDLPGIRLVGNLLVQTMDVRHGAWNKRKLPTFYFSDPVNSSPTTFIGMWINSNPQTDMRGLQYTYQGSGGDRDDLAFACHMAFDSSLGGLWISSGNGALFGPGCHNFVLATGDINSSGLDRFGVALSSPRGYVGPVDDACSPGYCSERMVGGTGPVFLNQITVQGYQTENLVSFHSTSSDLNLWIEGEPPDGHGVTLGAGTCTSDGSVCALDRDCPSGSCSTQIVNPQQLVTMRGYFHGPLALGPGARDLFGQSGTRTTGIELGGYWSGLGLSVLIHPRADAPLNLSGLRSGEPLPVPTSYAGLFTPQLPLSYHSTDCTTLSKGQWQQQCCDRDTWSCYVCDPDNGGRSTTLCDAPVDWVRLNQSSDVLAAASSRTLSAAEASGSVVTNQGATRPVVLTLPAASPGLCLKIALARPFDVDVDPHGNQQILRETDRPGDALSSDATVGSVLELCAVSTEAWVIVGKIGSWTDVD